MNHEEIHDSLEAYALDALDDDERAVVATHLAGCEECRATLLRYEGVVATLPAALALASPVPPSDVAKQRISRAVRGRNRWQRVSSGVAVTAVVLLAAAVVWGWRSDRALANERERRERLVAQQEIFFEVVDSPTAERLVLKATSDRSTAYGKVFTTPDLPFVVVMAGRLPDLDDGRGYHAWVTGEDGTTELAGVLTPNPAGFASLVYSVDTAGPEVVEAYVTAQPDGATSPSGEPIIAGQTT